MSSRFSRLRKDPSAGCHSPTPSLAQEKDARWCASPDAVLPSCLARCCRRPSRPPRGVRQGGRARTQKWRVGACRRQLPPTPRLIDALIQAGGLHLLALKVGRSVRDDPSSQPAARNCDSTSSASGNRRCAERRSCRYRSLSSALRSVALNGSSPVAHEVRRKVAAQFRKGSTTGWPPRKSAARPSHRLNPRRRASAASGLARHTSRAAARTDAATVPASAPAASSTSAVTRRKHLSTSTRTVSSMSKSTARRTLQS